MSNEIIKSVQFVKCPFCDRVIPDLPFIKYSELVNHSPSNWRTAVHSFAICNMKYFKLATKQQIKKADKIWRHRND